MKKRLNSFLLINGIVLLFWLGCLFAVQFLDPYNLADVANLRPKPHKEIIIPNRGNIYDRNNKLLVSSIRLYQLDIDMHLIRRAANRQERELTTLINEAARIISDNSDLSFAFVKNRMQPDRSSVYIADSFTESQIARIRTAFRETSLPVPKDTFSKIRRVYPHDKLAARIIGSTNENVPTVSNELYSLNGIRGLEATYDALLTGKYGWEERINDAHNNKIPKTTLQKREVQHGHSLVLTLDAQIQEMLENSLQNGLSRYDAKHAMGIIMEVNTGEVVAMAGLARDDKFRSANELRSLPNLPVSFLFEPGSTMKPITAMLALEKGLLSPTDKMDCTKYTMDNRVIKDDHDYEKLTLRDIIAYSSNVGISRLVEKVGSQSLYDRMVEMGFGHTTGSNLSGEISGTFRQLRDWQGFSLHSLSFGHEISVTTLQLATAYCAIANRGKVLRPYIVREIRDANDNVVRQNSPRVVRKISRPAALDTLSSYLQSVVDYGTATGTRLNYINIAGKTGTAEKIIDGEYSKEKYTSIFAGFFPVDFPKYVIVIVFDEPMYENYYYYASMSAVPTFKELVTNIISLPSNTLLADISRSRHDFVSMPDVTGKSIEQVRKALGKKNIHYQFIIQDSSATAIIQYPQADVSFDRAETAVVIFGQPKQTESVASQKTLDPKMPSLVGLPLRKALKEAQKRNIRLVVDGNGIVYEQSIKVGTQTDYGEICYVKAR